MMEYLRGVCDRPKLVEEKGCREIYGIWMTPISTLAEHDAPYR